MNTDQEKKYLRISSLTACSTPVQVTKRLKNADPSANFCPRCEIEMEEMDPCIDCAMCGARYCLKCAKVSQCVYEELEHGNLEGFTWHCAGCKVSLPSLRSIDKTLKQMDQKTDHRLRSLEHKLDSLDMAITEKVTEQVKTLKTEVVEDVTNDLDKMIDRKIKEYEDQQRRVNNLMLYNMPEINNPNPEIRRAKDIENITRLANDIGIAEVEIKAAIRIGNRWENQGKTRPLKLVMENNHHRKILLDNAKYIGTKSVEYKNAVITRDMTPKQREEWKLLRSELKTRRDAGEIVTIRQGKVVKLHHQPKHLEQRNQNLRVSHQNEPMPASPIQHSQAPQNLTNDTIQEPVMDISSIHYNDNTVIGGIPTTPGAVGGTSIMTFNPGAGGGTPHHQ